MEHYATSEVVYRRWQILTAVRFAMFTRNAAGRGTGLFARRVESRQLKPNMLT